DQAASTALGFTSDFFSVNSISSPTITQTGSAGDASHAASVVDFFGDNWPVTIGAHAVGSTIVGAEVTTSNLLINPPPFAAAPFFLPAQAPLIPITSNPG